jgi:DUF4097 and DUF4098 domain-containing protein YvlB
MPDPAPRLTVATRTGRVRIVAEPGASLHVRGGSVVSHPDGSVSVESGDGGRGELLIRCAAGTDVLVGTSTGRVELSGTVGDARVTTRTGRISVEAAGTVDLRSSSGRVDVGACSGACRVVTRTGSVTVGHAGVADIVTETGSVTARDVESATVHSGTGRVELGVASPPHVTVRTHSGSVEIAVPEGSRPDTRLSSRSGRVRCECEPGDDGAIDVETGSGRIRVTCV